MSSSLLIVAAWALFTLGRLRSLWLFDRYLLWLVCARQVSFIIISSGFALSATRLSLIRRERRQRD